MLTENEMKKLKAFAEVPQVGKMYDSDLYGNIDREIDEHDIERLTAPEDRDDARWEQTATRVVEEGAYFDDNGGVWTAYSVYGKDGFIGMCKVFSEEL